MSQVFLTLTLVLTSLLIKGQVNFRPNETTFKKRDYSKTIGEDISISIRGKVASLFFIEDWFCRTGTIGAEIIYNNKHSLGVDASFFRWRYQTDDPDPIPLYDELEKRTFIYLDYKLSIHSREKSLYYLNLYSKIGNYDMWYEKYENDTSILNLDFINTTADGKFSEFGLGLGAKFYFSSKKNWGIDISLNAAIRNTNYEKEVYDTGIRKINLEVQEQRYVPFLKINFFYAIKNEK